MNSANKTGGTVRVVAVKGLAAQVRRTAKACGLSDSYSLGECAEAMQAWGILVK